MRAMLQKPNCALRALYKEKMLKRDELSTLIRELLLEELAAIRKGSDVSAPPRTREETVTIRSDSDLNRFARRVLDLAKKPDARAEIEAGRHTFRLGHGVSVSAAPSVRREETTEGFDKGLITEKEIMSLPKGLGSIRAGKAVCFTPLALDVLRQRGIKVERTKQ